MSAGTIDHKRVAERLRDVAKIVEEVPGLQGAWVFAAPDGAIVTRIVAGDPPANFWHDAAQMLADESKRREIRAQPYDGWPARS